MSGEDRRTISAMDVAGYLVANSDKAVGRSFTNLKLQKLLYYAQGFALALRGQPLFSDSIQAWDNGPVVCDVYHQYKNGCQPIIRPAEFEPDCYPPEDRELLDAILGTYGQIPAIRLSGLTHAEPPWSEAYNLGRNTPLAVPTMKSFFSRLAEEAREQRSSNGRPIFPIASLHHQERRKLSDRMDAHRDRLRSIIRARPPGSVPWPDDES